MRLYDQNWMRIEAYLRGDDRVVLPLGSTEQHAYLSLGVDSILAERVAVEAAEPLGVPVLPVLPYGLTPYFLAYPGTVSLKVETYARVVCDVLDSLAASGFRRVLIVNGHGGNAPAHAVATEWMASNLGVRVKFHNWWNAPRTLAKVQETDPVATHASWMENFAWTRLANVELPNEQKPTVPLERLRVLNPQETREFLGDGNYGGFYQRPDEEMTAIWQAAVDETRDALKGPWS